MRPVTNYTFAVRGLVSDGEKGKTGGTATYRYNPECEYTLCRNFATIKEVESLNCMCMNVHFLHKIYFVYALFLSQNGRLKRNSGTCLT